MVSAWDTLGIAADADEPAVRRAYAALVRQFRPDSHPQEFARLREAYEYALRHVRARAPGEQGEAAAAPPREAPPLASAAPMRVPAPAPAPAPQHERPYATAEAMVAELARCFSEAGDAAAVQLLREQFASVSAQTVDARSEWEVVFVHSLLNATAPPVSLVFEGGRLLRWSERGDDMVHMVGEDGARRLRLLLAMAHEGLYARFFSPNRWHARLFGLGRMPWFGLSSQVAGARQLQAGWKQLCEATGLPAMLQQLDPRALRRLEGMMLLSTDVVVALTGAWLAWLAADTPLGSSHAGTGLARAALTFVLLVPLPWLARWLWSTPVVQRLRAWKYVAEGMSAFTTIVVVLVVMFAGTMIAISDSPAPVRFAGAALVAVFGAGVLVATGTGIWISTRALEFALALPWLWLQRTWGGHAFACMQQGRSAPGWREQLRQLPAAAAASWQAFRAGRRRHIGQQRDAVARSAAFGGSRFNWWWICWGLIALARLASHLGGS